MKEKKRGETEEWIRHDLVVTNHQYGVHIYMFETCGNVHYMNYQRSSTLYLFAQMTRTCSQWTNRKDSAQHSKTL
jgi:hypothetical protein